MSRLDSAIRRLQAQRACLNAAAEAVADRPGVVFELGLGNGRTYDHLRESCAGREIFVFERQVAAHPDCVPDDAHLYLGDVLETLPQAAERFAGQVALLHADIGTGDAARNARLAGAIQPFLPHLLVPGGIAVTDQEMPWPDAEQVALPDGVAPGRYFLYRRVSD
ncbi:class I SAM-dependent methyltransferase [Rhodovibrio salinarum]|uniref:S-adenosyl-L-methionine methyltransferase n=1 Tax=Rhodovibrio salinarum TaxID=1087 RepID=A0A934QH16_9PROT|nr:class I SAM-dependent methyltransferase [Rhodovibrio salinarum]MBK1696846.1 hypothetical protein [Rhodovibrio salinarum]